MKHSQTTDDIRDRMALYALGLLEPDESDALRQHLTEGCVVCETELDSCRGTTGLLGFLTARPSPLTREALLARIAEPASADVPPPPKPALITVRADEGEWRTIGEGLRRKLLYKDEASQLRTVLLEMAPGATYPEHLHCETEQCLVLSGEVRDSGRVLRTGDFQCLPCGSNHEPSHTEEGCLLLIVLSG